MKSELTKTIELAIHHSSMADQYGELLTRPMKDESKTVYNDSYLFHQKACLAALKVAITLSPFNS